MTVCIVTNFFSIEPTRRTNFTNSKKKNYMFWAFPLPIIRSYLLYIRQWYISCRYDDSFPAGSGWKSSSILTLLGSCHQTCKKYTIAECTVYNSWWRLRWSSGYHAGFWHQSLRVQTRPKPLDFYGRKNPQHAFLRRGSNRICPMSQLCGM